MERTREADLPAIIAHNGGARAGRAVRGWGRTLRAAAARYLGFRKGKRTGGAGERG